MGISYSLMSASRRIFFSKLHGHPSSTLRLSISWLNRSNKNLISKLLNLQTFNRKSHTLNRGAKCFKVVRSIRQKTTYQAEFLQHRPPGTVNPSSSSLVSFQARFNNSTSAPSLLLLNSKAKATKTPPSESAGTEQPNKTDNTWGTRKNENTTNQKKKDNKGYMP
ncbi:UNVERIFIED_CONTAM: hypothetical protein Slati_4450300 [Sesamum latifolium]|uniref:Uncharacterized protein n=1 Tax=Sesamum latifolium TaxID=2727402 RepID=A0AAW2STF8_9LAMI